MAHEQHKPPRGATDKTLLTSGYGMFLGCWSRVKRADLPVFWVV